MADENIMSLIQNLFIEETNLVNQQQQLDLNDNKFQSSTFQSNDCVIGSGGGGGGSTAFNSTKSISLDSDLSSKKLNLLKQITQNQLANNAILKQNSPSTFFNELTNPLLRSITNSQLTPKSGTELQEQQLNDLLFSLNGNSQSKPNYDLLNNNTTPTNQNQLNEHSTLPISPLSTTECSIKQTSNLLTPNSLQTTSASTNLYNNFGLISSSNNQQLLLQQQQQQQQQQQHQNNSSTLVTIGNNLISSPISSNNSLGLTSNQSTNLSHSTSTANSANSFADLILGCDDGHLQNFNSSFGLQSANQLNLKDSNKLAQNAFNNVTTFDASPVNPNPDSFIYTEEDRFESQIRSLANEVHSTIQLHMNSLHMRREALLQQLEHVKKIYFDVLRKKKAVLNGNKQTNLQFEKFILPTISFNKPDSAIYKAISQLGFLNTPAFGPFCTASGDGLECTIPGVNSQFIIETRNCFNDELLVGRENISIEILALFGESTSELNSISNEQAKLANLANYTSKSVIPHTFFDHNNGKYTVTYNVPVLKNIPQELVIKININALPINDSPIRVKVQTQKRQNWKLATTFGSEGNGIGALCRPWGVSIVKMPSQLLMNYQNNPSLLNGDLSLTIDTANNSLNTSSINSSSSPTFNSTAISNLSSTDTKLNEQHYLIGIADRSNNRIQLLDYNSKSQQINVINVFGSGPGTRPGMFDRPAGICINLALGHIIVADKDNHRIQVFSLTGRYLFKFGEKGNRIGQYPWDLDSCASTHQIAVSDTRNRRIQLFTPYGQYVNHFSLLLDSPRGVKFLPDKRLVVSDFNKHRILIFDKLICNPNLGNQKDGGDLSFSNLNSPKIIGFGEGSQFGEFLRPQGVAVSGNCIFCADSRNNRICIYNMSTQSFEYLDEELSLDRPSDLSVIDENLLVIIDFGNNRLQILQR